MSNNLKAVLVFIVLMVPITLLIEYASHDKHLTLVQGIIAVVLQAIPFFLTRSIIKWISTQQPVKPVAKKQ
jgi:quinol-cytochrome oxidoreductase complex cytochrome b subunit